MLTELHLDRISTVRTLCMWITEARMALTVFSWPALLAWTSRSMIRKALSSSITPLAALSTCTSSLVPRRKRLPYSTLRSRVFHQ